MKSSTITIEEKLSKPEDSSFVQDFDISNGAIPIFGSSGLLCQQQMDIIRKNLVQMEPLVVFWGLSGNLGCFYSKIQSTLNEEELNAKITLEKPTQPFNIYRESKFKQTMKELFDIDTVVREIHFEEAILIIQGKKQPPTAVYEEPDEEDCEFDEDCTPDCRIGEHKCGK